MRALNTPLSRWLPDAALMAAAALLAAGCAVVHPLNSVSAGTLAARLANERCQRSYGARPFAPEDFEAVRESDAWHWGTATGGKVDGYEVEVSFDDRGGHRKVDVRIPPE
jgi:hypothetical protein